jgi:hypothetical protein
MTAHSKQRLILDRVRVILGPLGQLDPLEPLGQLVQQEQLVWPERLDQLDPVEDWDQLGPLGQLDLEILDQLGQWVQLVCLGQVRPHFGVIFQLLMMLIIQLLGYWILQRVLEPQGKYYHH